MRSIPFSRWIVLVGLPILGLGVLWWASEQLAEARLIMGSTFEFQHWRVLGWLLTLIAAGAIFGIAAGNTRDRQSEAKPVATLIVGVLPLLVVAYYWTYFFGWLPTIRWMTEPTVIASCTVVGFLLGGLASDRLNRPDTT